MTPENWVIIERSNGAFHQLTTHPVLHRAECPHVKRARPENVYPAFNGPQTVTWVFNNATGFERTCRTCIKEF